MRYLIVLISCLSLHLDVFAQVDKLELSQYNNEPNISAFETVILKNGFQVPLGSNLRVFTVKATAQDKYPNTQPTGDRNFVMVRNFKVSGVNTGNLNVKRNLSEESQQVTYYDNLGRQIQGIDVMGSSSFKDVVIPVRYDAQGRKAVDYLPYVEQGNINGSYKSNDLTAQSTFYSGTGFDPFTAKTGFPYSKTVYDNSPSDKVKEQGAVGADWQPNGRTARFEETLNNNVNLSNTAATRKVRKFTVNSQDTSALAIPTADGYYADNQLKVAISKNNNWVASDGRINTSEAYLDKNGKTVLSRAFIKAESGETIILSTYYVYSDLGELYFVLPPALNPDVATMTSANIDLLGYRYTYDWKRRLIQKKEPGIAAYYYIYNNQNQLVASQSPKLRLKNQWNFIKYDAQGRTIMSGSYTSTESFTALRTAAEAAALTYEKPSTSSTGYTNTAWPTSGIASYAIINYYDNYNVNALPASLSYSAFAGNVKVDYPTGMATVTKTWEINNANTVLWTVNYYDRNGRCIQTKSTNHLGGIDQVDNQFNFTGELVSAERKHSGTAGQAVNVKNEYTYDQNGRALTLSQKINNQEEIKVVANTYNELGQLVDKKLHQAPGQTKFLQSIDYRYNERGWLTSINDPNLTSSSTMNDGDSDSNADLFGSKLEYNTHAKAPQFNGNVASFQWKTSKVASQSVAPPKMGYQYRYDALNRMTAAISEKNDIVDNAHSEFVKYNSSGSITNLGRYAFTNNAVQQIDSLVYTYQGYRSLKIDDVSNASSKALGLDDKVVQAVEQTYDANGNMIKDSGKGIEIAYNDLDLPAVITFGTGHRLELMYDRTGKKLQANYINGTASYKIDYVDGIQYRQNQIEFIHTEEGRARLNAGSYVYEYDIKDHLGNVRVTFVPDANHSIAKVVQQNSYYAYGLSMYGDAANGLNLAYAAGEKSKFLYSGKELYDQGGLNWYDHGSRLYDPATGKWSAMDPASQFVNPYLAMGNNPAIYIDPNGEWIVPVLIGAAVGVLGNGLGNAIKGDSFFKGWTGAALMGAVTAYGAVSGMQGASIFSSSWSSSMASLSTYPGTLVNSMSSSILSKYSLSMSIGNFGIGVGPSLFMGTNGWGYGLNYSLGYSSENFDIGFSSGFTAWNKNIFTGSSFVERRMGGQIGIGGEGFKLSLGTMSFKGGNVDQRTGSIGFYGKNWAVHYENDWLGHAKLGSLPLGDGGDRWRTTGIRATVGDVSTTLLMVTGDPSDGLNLTKRPSSEINGKKTYDGENTNMFRLGSWTFGYKGFNIGTNSEDNRNIFQNKFAHGNGQNYPIFPVLSNMVNLDVYYRTLNPFTVW
ncbi:DUF6443 domain-containing protein [Sphingobacterium siyangense]|uniref:DUF6443 domain-containing protein n=1 Tax=Sphingobacterium siyangense TaxID=459529 RepID=UPI003DA411B7